MSPTSIHSMFNMHAQYVYKFHRMFMCKLGAAKTKPHLLYNTLLGIRRVRSRMPRAAVIIRLGDTRRGACPFADLASTKARSLSRSG